MGHGGGAKARLVGEYAPGKSLAHSHHNGIAEYAAPHRLKAEGAGEDGGQGRRHLVDPQQDHRQPRPNVKDGHEGHHVGGHPADSLDSAQHHNAYHHRQEHAGGQAAHPEQPLHRPGDLAALGDVPDPEAGEARHQ